MAGYLPDNGPYVVGNKAKAISASYSDARDDQSAYNEGADKEYRYVLSGKGGDYWLQAPQGASYHYWISEGSADLEDIEEAYCDNCEMPIRNDRAYRTNDDYIICRDCL